MCFCSHQKQRRHFISFRDDLNRSASSSSYRPADEAGFLYLFSLAVADSKMLEGKPNCVHQAQRCHFISFRDDLNKSASSSSYRPADKAGLLYLCRLAVADSKMLEGKTNYVHQAQRCHFILFRDDLNKSNSSSSNCPADEAGLLYLCRLAVAASVSKQKNICVTAAVNKTSLWPPLDGNFLHGL